MKKIFTILFLIVSLYGYSQNKIPEGIKIVGVYTISIVLNAVGDGLNDNGNKIMGHLCTAASISTLVVTPFIFNIDKKNWYYYALSYVTLRIALFDPIYNMTRGLPITYIGNTSLWDKGLQKLNPPDGFMFGRSVFLVIGVVAPVFNVDHVKHYRKEKVFKVNE